jgi:hypothetical protein
VYACSVTGRDGTVGEVVDVVDVLMADVLVEGLLVEVVLVEVVLVEVVLVEVVGLCTRTAWSLAAREQPVRRDASRARVTRRRAIHSTVPTLQDLLRGGRCGRASDPDPTGLG